MGSDMDTRSAAVRAWAELYAPSALSAADQLWRDVAALAESADAASAESDRQRAIADAASARAGQLRQAEWRLRLAGWDAWAALAAAASAAKGVQREQ